MGTSSSPFRLVAVLSIVTIINIGFFGFTNHWSDPSFACSVDSVITGVAKYIRHNGKRKLEDSLPETCLKVKPNQDTKDTLNSALQSLIDQCNNKASKPKLKPDLPIITLFTTWPHDPSKEKLHNITMQNWLSFRPKVEIAVFSNDTRVVSVCESLNIRVLPILKHGGGGSPVLKEMFHTVQQYFNSSLLYGYVNSDILFTDNLIESLEVVLNERPAGVPMMMVGKRINVLNVTEAEASTYADITSIASSRGILFSANAEDYFFTNKAFPWDSIVDVVVGRVAYDNWLVGHVICKLKIDVIELTDSLTAVHQTTSKGGNFEGFQHKQAHYNEGIFKSAGIVPVYEAGFTICAQEYTHINLCGDVELSRREKFWDKCACATERPNHQTNSG